MQELGEPRFINAPTWLQRLPRACAASSSTSRQHPHEFFPPISLKLGLSWRRPRASSYLAEDARRWRRTRFRRP